MTLRYLTFVAIVVAIMLPFWIAGRIALARKERRPISFDREALLAIFFCYVTSLAALTIAPNQLSQSSGAGHVNFIPVRETLRCLQGLGATRACIRNGVGNVIAFFPLGLLLPFIMVRVRTFGRMLLVATLCSVAIESTQFVEQSMNIFRTVDIDDVIFNVAGAMLGALIGIPAVRRAVRGRTRRRH